MLKRDETGVKNITRRVFNDHSDTGGPAPLKKLHQYINRPMLMPESNMGPAMCSDSHNLHLHAPKTHTSQLQHINNAP
jgi:hypothetical protein